MTQPYAPKITVERFKQLPGRVVGVFGVTPTDLPPNKVNPLVIHLVVSPYRKDYRQVVKQLNKKPTFSRFGQSLLDSCFKNW